MDFIIVAAVGFLIGGFTGAAWGVVIWAVITLVLAIIVGLTDG